jgi:hypothetical protein
MEDLHRAESFVLGQVGALDRSGDCELMRWTAVAATLAYAVIFAVGAVIALIRRDIA